LECAALISATVFAKGYTTAWKSIAPTTDIFVRRLNANLYAPIRDREFPPLQSVVDAKRRGLINEIAFKLFARSMVEIWSNEAEIIRAISEAAADVQVANARLRGMPASEFASPTQTEIEEVFSLFERLRWYFALASEGARIELYPKFAGCGILDTSAGDVYFSGKLYEVKAGDRSFLSVDIKQLLVYAALNKAAAARELNELGLFNPRTGVSFTIALNQLCLEISGRPSDDLLTEIIRVVSSGDISR
jgi:hypothetical protein